MSAQYEHTFLSELRSLESNVVTVTLESPKELSTYVPQSAHLGLRLVDVSLSTMRPTTLTAFELLFMIWVSDFLRIQISNKQTKGR
jgi:hypothetical protein